MDHPAASSDLEAAAASLQERGYATLPVLPRVQALHRDGFAAVPAAGPASSLICDAAAHMARARASRSWSIPRRSKISGG